ncbi:MAG: serine/threonine protein kinase [Deltaproteobacteria bacterium]|nr:serine/threonine protein kinase [Deltaproteobacteria bacterium]
MDEVFLGRYRVDERLGHGGMATIWRCTDLVSMRQVAVKLLSAKADSARALLEGEAMAAVRHPNVVRLLDFGLESGGRPCLVMELVHGEVLRARLDREGFVPWNRAFGWGAAVLNGLSAIHDADFMHRDVKPANIMVPHRPEDAVKLIDLGIVTPRVPSEPRLTQTGMVIGTPGYMAPELLMGGTPGVAADIYSLGMVLWEAIGGIHPVKAGLDQAIAKLSFRPKLATLPTGAPPLPDAARLLLTRMLRAPLEERLDNARECAALMRSVILGHRQTQPEAQAWSDTVEIDVDFR